MLAWLYHGSFYQSFLIFLFVCLFPVLGKIQNAVGSAQLLMAQKFYQFRELCEENLVCIVY